MTATGLTVVDRPEGDDELWKYSRIDDLDLDRYRLGAREPAGDVVEHADTPDAVPAELAEILRAVGARSGLVLLRDGGAHLIELSPGAAAKGLTIERRPRPLAHAVDSFVRLNGESAPEAVVISVPKGVGIEEPLLVLHWIETDGGASFPRVAVELGESAQLTVVEHLAGPDVDALTVPVIELDVGDGGNLSWLSIQELGRRVWQLGYQTSTVGRSASLVSATIALGGYYARSRMDANLAGEGSSANLVALYFGDGDQMHDFRTLQDHHGRKSSSDLLFKGAVTDASHAVYSGLIRVNPGASGTSAFLTNRNIVLGDEARVDSVPNLDIVRESDLRQCGHASASGPIDEDQRFYLESRGVPSDVAERLIVLGFFEDVLTRLPVPSLLPSLRARVAAKLDGTTP